MSSRSTYSIRLSEDEKARLTAQAESQGMKLGEYVRHQLLGSPPVTPGAYSTLEAQIKTLNTAMSMAGLDDAITKARAALGQKEE